MLRTFIDDPEKEARYAAVLAILGFVDLPIIHFSVEWWRTLHQPQSILHAWGQYFVRLARPTSLHEYWDVFVVLLHAHGQNSIAVYDSFTRRQKGTIVEPISFIQSRFMTTFYARWGAMLLAMSMLSILIYNHYQQDLATLSPQHIFQTTSTEEVRLLGMVRGGTLSGKVDAGDAQFEVVEGNTSLPVKYQGPSPENLRELKTLVLIGKWNPTTKVFEARDIGLVTNYGYVMGAYLIGLLPLMLIVFTMSRRVSLLYAEIKESKLYQPE